MPASGHIGGPTPNRREGRETKSRRLPGGFFVFRPADVVDRNYFVEPTATSMEGPPGMRLMVW